MKSLMIGAFSNYDWDEIAPWVKSIESSGFQGDKVMIAFIAKYDTVLKLIEHGFQVVAFNRDEERQMVTYESPNRVHIERFIHIHKFLKDRWRDYDYVVTTDVGDVVFQTDPVQWLRENLGDKKLVVGGEAIRYRDEPWNRENLFHTYGPQIYELFKDNEVYNVGTLGGTAEAVMDVALNIFTASVNRQIPIVDQAAFNVVIQSPPVKGIVKFAGHEEGFACQAGVNADPLKIEEFRPFLMGPAPVFDNGVVKTADGKIFSIVHQYNRVPQWKDYFLKKYVDP